MTDPSTKRPIWPINPQPRTFKSKVIAEFVDEIPTPSPKKFQAHQTTWESQSGIKEALMKAFNHPGKAMILVDYDGKDERKASPSRRRDMAGLRARSLIDQGYSERMGWTVRAVETKVFVMYNPVEDKW